MTQYMQGYDINVECQTGQSYMTILNDQYRHTYRTVIQQGGKHYIRITGEQSALIPYGTYRYQILNPDGLESYGDLEITINYSLLQDGQEYRSQYQILLDAIRNVLAGRASRAQYSMTIDGKAITYMSLSELMKLQKYYEGKVAQQQGRYRHGNQAVIQAVFNRNLQEETEWDRLG